MRVFTLIISFVISVGSIELVIFFDHENLNSALERVPVVLCNNMNVFKRNPVTAESLEIFKFEQMKQTLVIVVFPSIYDRSLNSALSNSPYYCRDRHRATYLTVFRLWPT